MGKAVRNKPSQILQTQIANPYGASGQNASQMQCLAVYVPIIIADKVPENCELWELYTQILEIYKIVVAPSISIDGTYYLQSKIKEHHQLFLKLFPDGHLIPKQHFLLHYPRAIRRLGPLGQFSSMRHEGKHRPLKQWVKMCNNFLKTIFEGVFKGLNNA